MNDTPSERARELVRGGFDLHVHIAPDVIERRIDDVALARRFEEVGLAGFVLKSHYVPTAERAAVVRGVVPGVQEGVRDIVVTHPEFPSQDLSVEDQLELARRGAFLERCFTTPHTGKCTWERWLEATRAVGPEATVVSSDLGQLDNPPVEDGLPLMAEKLMEA